MACGFIGILYGFHGEFYKACMFIVLGAIFDSVDGRVARITNTQSSFGEQFDSLSDLVSFGVAPAIVFYFRFLTESGRPGMVAAFFFILCGALRLARFNANIDKNQSDYFQGLPIPGGATAVVGYILLSLDVPELMNKGIAVVYILFYAALMISSLPFPSFKKSEWVKKNRRKVLMIIFLIFASLFIYEEIMIPLIITFYVVASMIYFLTHRKQFEGIFDWQEEPELESEVDM